MPAGEPRLFAVAGDPVAQSLSPVMHNAAIAALGLDAVYVAARTTVRAFPGLVRAILEGGGGLNVTAPYKPHAAALLAEPTADVVLTGSCNTIWGEADRPRGDNTDIIGIREAVRALMGGAAVTRARVYGSGATGRSAAVALTREWPGVVVGVHSRFPQHEQEFLAWAAGAGVRAEVAPMLRDDARELDVNTTPPHAPLFIRPVDEDGRADPVGRMPQAFLDLNYGLRPTPLAAPLVGGPVRLADGRGVLVAQGAASFERFFGIPAPVSVMRQAVEDALRA